jgi:predicted unusual protein kinase regulating ubiquinone biosynthesis (AarF/ABC1/UbiB family)
MAGRAALGFGKRLTGKPKDEVNAELMDKAAQQLFTVLGELKGGAMKVGQALSVMEAAIPEQYGKPYREALTKLQREAPPLPAAKVHRVLDAQLGTKWRERFGTRRSGRTVERSQSRSNTRAPTRRCAPT